MRKFHTSELMVKAVLSLDFCENFIFVDLKNFTQTEIELLWFRFKDYQIILETGNDWLENLMKKI